MGNELEGYGEYTYHKEFVDMLTEVDLLDGFINITYGVKTGKVNSYGANFMDEWELEVVTKIGEESYKLGLEEYNTYCSLCVYYDGFRKWSHMLDIEESVADIKTMEGMEELLDFGRSLEEVPEWVNIKKVNEVISLKLHDLYIKYLDDKKGSLKGVNIDGSTYYY